MAAQLPDRTIRELVAAVGAENALLSAEDRLCHAFDGTFAEQMPDIVVLPTSTEAVSRALAIAWREGISVTPQGMGSGLAAGGVPFGGGIALSLTRMDRILEIDRENMTATVEAGVITAYLAERVEAVGLFYPPDPGSIKHSTVGGNVATNAGGPRCLKYGVTGDYVLGLTVVLADGRVLRLGGKSIKNATGYRLIPFFVGSEGTLGIITQVLVRLVLKPRAVRTALAIFPRLADASQTVTRVLAAGVVPTTLELLDQTAVACIEAAMPMGLPLDKEAILLLEADGHNAAVVQQEMETIACLCREGDASEVRVAASETDRGELWRARRSLTASFARRAPNYLGEDVCVPRSEIPGMIEHLRTIGRAYDLPLVIFGHAGDGNLHPTPLFDKRDTDQWARVEAAAAETFAAAVALGGTLSGEHGIGMLKRDYMPLALGPVSLDIQRRLKKALDPRNILNPGKVLPPESQDGSPSV